MGSCQAYRAARRASIGVVAMRKKAAIDFRSGFFLLFLIPFDLYKDLVACYNTFVSFKLSSEDLS